ncbi:RNA polymerase sigma factor [Rhodothermus profundi]|uniref:RNA polymerase sigma-70 factor, ECF subfamily n=1 Tax=Rhodothermus profundi TaxID=633813 RepID=A0A1M6TDY7_9BACT|nr:sigma-70 family RNA polymerase sigma factor [Rhodothermus profundi]SHK55207.1 RNA polymerase sigma-70 factor, ECF subfamily [Rhodothermus profundi]
MARAPDISTQLVARARQGEAEAQNLLLRRLEPVLRAFFLKRLGDVPEIDDLVQNTLLRVHTGLTDLKDNARLKAFAMKAALFELQDFYRGRYHGREQLYDPEQPPSVGHEAGGDDPRLDLEQALQVLTPHARRILELRAYGYRYQEIARLLGTTEAAVKMQVKRAFEKMRRLLLTGGWWMF